MAKSNIPKGMVVLIMVLYGLNSFKRLTVPTFSEGNSARMSKTIKKCIIKGFPFNE